MRGHAAARPRGAADRALADAAWLRERLAEVEAGGLAQSAHDALARRVAGGLVQRLRRAAGVRVRRRSGSTSIPADAVIPGKPMTAQGWRRAAMERPGLYARWTVTGDKQSALDLERQVERLLPEGQLWNRSARPGRTVRFNFREE